MKIELEKEVEKAKHHFKQGIYRDALNHISAGLLIDINNQELLILLDDIIQKAPNPKNLIEIEEGMFYGLIAIKAYIHAKLEDFNTAIELIYNLLLSYPNAPFVEWIVDWISNPQSKSLTSIKNMYVSLLITADNVKQNSKIQKGVLSILPIFDSVLKDAPNKWEINSWFANIYRKLEDDEKALEYAQKGIKTSITTFSCLELAHIYKNLGEHQNAIKHYKQVLEITKPTEHLFYPTMLDLADLLLNLKQMKDALEYYKKVVKHDPNHSWALPSLYYCRYIIEKKKSWKEKLTDFLSKNPTNSRAISLLNELQIPYIEKIPQIQEATVNIISYLMKKQSDGPIELGAHTLTSLESPSSIILLWKIAGEKTNIIVSKIPIPDPRKPRRDVDYLLWLYDEVRPIRVLNPPDENIMKDIETLAQKSYSLDSWKKKAKKLGQIIGPERINDLLATMIYPSDPPEGFMLWDWMHRLQVASALVIAHLDKGWDNSIRKMALTSLALGPMDWTINAALVGLLVVALDESKARKEIIEIFVELYENMPSSGGIPYLKALFSCIFLIPGLPNTLSKKFGKIKEELIENGIL